MRVNDDDPAEDTVTDERLTASPWLTADEAAAKICEMRGVPFVPSRGSDALTFSKLKARELTALRRRREALEEKLRLERGDADLPAPSRLVKKDFRMKSRVPAPETVKQAHVTFNCAFKAPEAGRTAGPADIKETEMTASVQITAAPAASRPPAGHKRAHGDFGGAMARGVAAAGKTATEHSMAGLSGRLTDLLVTAASMATFRERLSPAECASAKDLVTVAGQLDGALKVLIAGASQLRNECASVQRRHGNE